MKAWPFLISANPYHENAVVVVPDFILEAQAQREVIRAAGGFETQSDEAIYFQGFRARLGVIDMVFRVVEGTGRQFGLDHDEPLLDRVHRPIQIIEGFVIRDRRPDQPFTAEQLDAAHVLIEPHFQSYWKQEEQWQPVSSLSFDLPAGSQSPLILKQEKSPTLPAETATISQVYLEGEGDRQSEKKKYTDQKFGYEEAPLQPIKRNQRVKNAMLKVGEKALSTTKKLVQKTIPKGQEG